MKLIYRGNYKGEEYLPKADLPRNAVKFREPDSPEVLNRIAVLFTIPCVIIIGIAIWMSMMIHGKVNYQFGNSNWVIVLLVIILTVIPHELLHAIAFGKAAKVELFVSLKNMMAFVVSTHPISKRRFIFMSLLPNIILGWIPLLIWVFIPLNKNIANGLLEYSILCILMGCGDYLNVWNAMKQMPKGSIQVLSGLNSYWYHKEEISVEA